MGHFSRSIKRRAASEHGLLVSSGREKRQAYRQQRDARYFWCATCRRFIEDWKDVRTEKAEGLPGVVDAFHAKCGNKLDIKARWEFPEGVPVPERLPCFYVQPGRNMPGRKKEESKVPAPGGVVEAKFDEPGPSAQVEAPSAPLMIPAGGSVPRLGRSG